MASISKMSGCNKYTVRFTDIDGNRKKMALATADKKTAETVRNMVERILAQKKTGEPDRILSNWLKEIPDDLHRRLENAGLLEARKVITLDDLFREYVEFYSSTRKPNTIVNWKQAWKHIIEYFGGNCKIEDVTEQKVNRFVQWLNNQKPQNSKRPNPKNPPKNSPLIRAKAKAAAEAGANDNRTLSPYNIGRRLRCCKAFFNYAKRRGWITINPFEFVKPCRIIPKDREYTVNQEDSLKILDACPNAQWRAIFVLARYIGVRVPSELCGLKWTDIIWSSPDNPLGIIRITDVKREHTGTPYRESPLWEEAEKELRTLFDESPEGQEYIFPGITPESNLRQRFNNIIFRAGVPSFPKAFHNLRSTRESEYQNGGVSPNDYCRWIGNSVTVAMESYIQYSSSDMRKGAIEFLTSKKAEPEKHGESENVPGTNILEVLENTLAGKDETGILQGTISGTISGTQAVEINCKEKQKETFEPRNCGDLQEKEKPCNCLQGLSIPPRGVVTDGTNHLYDNGLHEMGNTVRAQFRAQSPKLQKLVSLFDSLSSEDKEIFITTITDIYPMIR